MLKQSLLFTLGLLTSQIIVCSGAPGGPRLSQMTTKTVIFGKPQRGDAYKCQFTAKVTYEEEDLSLSTDDHAQQVTDYNGKKIPQALWLALSEQIKAGSLQCIETDASRVMDADGHTLGCKKMAQQWKPRELKITIK